MFQGAEARIYVKGRTLIKKRIKKSYRIKEIDDELRRTRTRREARILQKLNKIVKTPKFIGVDDTEIMMEYIDGQKVSEILNAKNYKRICQEIGNIIGKLHTNNIIHGDLTTSNFILKGDVYIIDFGLSFHSTKIEDKAVDLHLLKHALESKHYDIFEQAFSEVVKSYLKTFKDGKDVLKRLEKVELRGRYKKDKNNKL